MARISCSAEGGEVEHRLLLAQMRQRMVDALQRLHEAAMQQEEQHGDEQDGQRQGAVELALRRLDHLAHFGGFAAGKADALDRDIVGGQTEPSRQLLPFGAQRDVIAETGRCA